MERYKNPYFYFGIVAIIFASAGIDFETLTTWPLFLEALKGIVMNPFTIGSVVVAIVGVWVNPTTKGLKD